MFNHRERSVKVFKCSSGFFCLTYNDLLVCPMYIIIIIVLYDSLFPKWRLCIYNNVTTQCIFYTSWFLPVIRACLCMYINLRYMSVSQSVQSLSHVQLFATPWITAYQASLSITSSRSLLKLMPIESVMPSSHLILCRSLLLLPPIPPSIRVFSNESALHMRWPKYWSFSFSISPFNEHPGLISFRMDWLDLLAVQGTLKSLLQHHSSKA